MISVWLYLDKTIWKVCMQSIQRRKRGVSKDLYYCRAYHHLRTCIGEKGKRVVRQKATFSVLPCSNLLDQRVEIQYVMNRSSRGGGIQGVINSIASDIRSSLDDHPPSVVELACIGGAQLEIGDILV